MKDHAALFDRDFLRTLETLNLIARRLVFGRRQALRASVKKGASIEFRDFRAYTPGDDPRTVDWSVYARLDELVIKLFRQEEELDLWALVDRSASMDFGEPNKFAYARRLAAALAYIGLCNMDSASVVPFDAELRPGRQRLRGRGRIFELLDHLTALPSGGRTDLPRAVREFLGRVRRPSLVVIVSDFYGLTGAQRAIDHLRFFKHQVFVLQVASPWELEPTVRGEYRLVDAETAEHEDLTLTDGLLRRYREAFDRAAEDLRRYCMRHAIGCALARTDVPFDAFLRRLLERGQLVA